MRRVGGLGLAGAIALSIAALGAGLARGQEAGSSYYALEGITVTATKTGVVAIDSLAGVTVVTPNEIDQIEPDRISDLLDSVPGVETHEDGDDPAAAINIRGLQDFGRVNVMIEGARQNFQRSGHSADGQFYLEPELIKQVDITRGPVATIYGSGAIGGVVNFELIDPDDIIQPGETWALHTKGKYDTNDEGRLVSVTGALKPSEAVSVLGNVVWREDENYEDGGGNTIPNTGEEVKSALLKSVISPMDGMTVKLGYLYQENDYVTGDTGNEQDTNTVNDSYTAKLHYDAPGTDLVDVTLSGYFTSTETDQTRISIPNPCLPAPFQVPPCTAVLGSERNFKIETKGFDGFNTSKFMTGAIEHTMTYGGDIFQDEVETADPLGSGDEFTPGGERTVWGTFVQDQINFGEWAEVIGALRYDAYELKSQAGSSEGERVSPKLTLGVTPIEGVQFFYTYAEGYRAPAITEAFNAGVHPAFPFFDIVSNPDLMAETARNREVGVNLSFDNVVTESDGFKAKAVYFDNHIRNYIDPVSYGTFNFPACAFGQVLCGAFQYQNVDKARIRGIEVEATYDMGKAFAKVAYSHIRGDDETAGVPLLTIYPDKLSTTVGLRFLDEKLVVGGRWLFVDSQYRIPPVTRAGSLVTPSDSYNVLDLFLTYDVNRYLSAAINLNNVLDEDYTKYLNFGSSSTSPTPSPGFSASFSATVKLGG